MLRQPIHSLSLFIHPVVSDSLQPHELQHARLPCPSPYPGIYPNSCLLSQWCHSTISSSVTPFSCPQSFPESESSPMSQLFTSGVQSIGASALSSSPHIPQAFPNFTPASNQHIRDLHIWSLLWPLGGLKMAPCSLPFLPSSSGVNFPLLCI